MALEWSTAIEETYVYLSVELACTVHAGEELDNQ
jgi:hypothetical protein